MAAIGVWLVADLDRGEIRPERAVGGSDLARGGRRFVVGHADRQQDLPAAAAGEHAERVHLCGSDRARRPRRPWGGGVGPGDVLVGGDAAEAQHAGPQRAQQPDQVAALCVPRELAERGHLEGKPEKPLGTGGPGANGSIVTVTGSGVCAGATPSAAVASRGAGERLVCAPASMVAGIMNSAQVATNSRSRINRRGSAMSPVNRLRV